MQVAKITLFNGQVYYTNEFSWNRLKMFFDNVRAKYGNVAPIDARNRVDLIEMTPEEYAAIPATVDSDALFAASPQPRKVEP
jgi:hypothetical protein